MLLLFVWHSTARTGSPQDALHLHWLYSADPAELGLQKLSYSHGGYQFSSRQPSCSGLTLYTQTRS